MPMFNLVDPADAPSKAPSINFNTDSMFDLLTGDVRRGFDGKWYINGGLGPAVCGGLGRPGMFKSTFATSLAMRMSALYGSQMAIFDSEDAVSRGRERILRMAGQYKDAVNDDYVLLFDAKNEYDLESIREKIYEIGERKKAAGKDALITTPFVDSKDSSRIRTLSPNVIIIDSYTECFSREEESFISDKGIDDSKAKTMFMLDANKKTVILRNLTRYAAQYNIELIVTAHYGTKLNLDPYAPAPKVLQYGSQNEAPKGVGSKFLFLTSPQFLINGCTKLQDEAKACKYRLGENTSPTDLSELLVLIQRCKNNASGLTHPFVISQDNGLLTDASDYSYLRNTGKGFSMTGNNINHQSMFLPDVTMTRNSFRGICQKDKRLIRALQLGAQLLYIQSNWNTAGWPFPIKVEPKALVDALMSDKDKMSMDRILASRGYWLPDELITPDTPEFMSIFDILEFFHNNHGVKLAEKK